jgi:hypothetical protein
VSCDENGPSLGPVRLLRRTMFGFEPRPQAELDFVFAKTFGAPIDWRGRMPDLLEIARALDEKNLALAMIMTLHLRLPNLNEAQTRRAKNTDALLKAGFNPDEPRDELGRWTSGGGPQIIPAQDVLVDPWIGDFPIRPIPHPMDIAPPDTAPDTVLPRNLPPLVNPYPDRPECVEEWNYAFRTCGRLLSEGKLGTRGYADSFSKCVLGLVSEACGGNPVGKLLSVFRDGCC